MHSFFWLYLTINAADFRLIPLDRYTFFEMETQMQITRQNQRVNGAHNNVRHISNMMKRKLALQSAFVFPLSKVWWDPIYHAIISRT